MTLVPNRSDLYLFKSDKNVLLVHTRYLHLFSMFPLVGYSITNCPVNIIVIYKTFSIMN